MAKGISLHIGINSVDPKHYADWDGKLNACEQDARDMLAIAKASGFLRSTTLFTAQATGGAILREIGAAARELVAGDLFFLTYSGHGDQMPDPTGDEADRKNETWLTYDRELIDNELYAMWSRFAPGVRIVVLSDSCHSGTVTRDLIDSPGTSQPVAVPRQIPREISEKVQAQHKSLYDSLAFVAGAARGLKVGASVLLISGCQDRQTSLDGALNGLFTATLLAVWRNGAFTGSYRDLHGQIVARMPATQQPNLFLTGASNPAFEGQRPFSIG